MQNQILSLTKRVNVQNALMRVLNSNATVESVTQTLLTIAGSTYDWDAATFWLLNPSRTGSRCIATWYKDSKQLLDFEKDNRRACFETAPENLPGLVICLNRFVFVSDLTQSANSLRLSALSAGLTSVVAIPVSSGNEPIGVIEFFSHQVRSEDPEFIELASESACQVALFLERRRAEKSALDQAEELLRLENKFKVILTSMREGVIQLNSSGRLVFMNTAAERILGYSVEDLSGKKIHDQIHRNSKTCKGWDCAVNTFTAQVDDEDMFDTKDGQAVAVRVNSNPIVQEHRTGYLLVFSEIAEVLKAREQRNSFISLLAHDLKGPMIAAKRLFEALLNDQLDPKQADILKLMQQNNEDGLQMVNHALQVYNSISSCTTTKVSLLDLVSSCQLKLKTTLKERDMSVNIFGLEDCDYAVDADETSLQHVLMNLLGNAIKFSGNEGRVELRVVADTDSVHILVRDFGCGIPNDELEMMFRPFWQGAFGKRQFGGSGLGLYLCKQIVECYKGKISITSKLGEGTTVDVELPISASTTINVKLPAGIEEARLETDRTVETERMKLNALIR